MSTPPTDWSMLCGLALLLGVRHGFDADHLATIDGLTRWSSRQSAAFARHCGLLFSLGHGVVVVAIAVGIGALSQRWAAPAWLNAFGAWVSIVFLLLLGIANFRGVLSATDGPVASRTPKTWLLGRLSHVRSGWEVAGVGALFALSFDTVSQAAFFAVSASQHGGGSNALVLGGLFVLGMVVTDALNGWWIAHLLGRADRVAVLASRIMAACVASVSLAVAGLGIARLLSPVFDAWADGRAIAFGGIVVGVVAVGYAIAMLLARTDRRTEAVTG